MFRKTNLYLAVPKWIEMLQSGLKCYINVAQKNVTTTNAMLKSLDIMSLRYIYIYILVNLDLN